MTIVLNHTKLLNLSSKNSRPESFANELIAVQVAMEVHKTKSKNSKSEYTYLVPKPIQVQVVAFAYKDPASWLEADR